MTGRIPGRIRSCPAAAALFVAGVAILMVVLFTSAGANDRFSPQERGHWAFQPVTRPPIPVVKQTALVGNPIDAFLLERLEGAGLSYSPPAEKRDLIRRVTFDLIGLPPTPEEAGAFLADTGPGAYERLVDRLLDSPHYGEHWGRMWLDVVRYAETAGYNADPLRPHAWKYRDYVIASFNADKPFDRFIEEQIAGDELFPDDPQAAIGSGYVLMWPDESNASNILLARQDALNDLTANVGSAFLGLSVGCAQCHDHKFDPLPQRDFYRLQAFFSGLIRRDEAALGTTGQLAGHFAAVARWRAETAPLREELSRLEHDARVKASGERRMKFPQIVLDALDTPPEGRSTLQRQMAFWSERQIVIKEADLVANLSPDARERRDELKLRLAEAHERLPKPPAELVGMIAGEIESQPPKTYLLAGGSYDKPLDEVAPGFLSVLFADGGSDAIVTAPYDSTSGRRSALAQWLSDPKNPLVPRVIVNRLWQGHFGRGLVENGNDFGTQTAPPTHPELLDWLAAELVQGRDPGAGVEGQGTRESAIAASPGTPPLGKGGVVGVGDAQVGVAARSDAPPPGQQTHLPRENAKAGDAIRSDAPPPGPPLLRGGDGRWSIKRLHRLIVTSTAYRQSSAPGDAIESAKGLASAQMRLRLYGRFDRRRLSAEGLRDALLAVSGELNPTVYGPSVYPELPPGFSRREAWKVSPNRSDRNRRSVYIHAKRNLPYPFLEAFDLPDMHESCARRAETTVAPQALMMLNSELVIDQGSALAGRLLAPNPQGEVERIVRDGFHRAFGRAPTSAETDDSIRFIAAQEQLAAERRSAGAGVLLPRGFPKFLDPARAAAVVDFCHALLNASEFVYVD